jgi:hypothetical protein
MSPPPRVAWESVSNGENSWADQVTAVVKLRIPPWAVAVELLICANKRELQPWHPNLLQPAQSRISPIPDQTSRVSFSPVSVEQRQGTVHLEDCDANADPTSLSSGYHRHMGYRKRWNQLRGIHPSTRRATRDQLFLDWAELHAHAGRHRYVHGRVFHGRSGSPWSGDRLCSAAR